MLDELPVEPSQVIWVCDNHSSHLSKLTKQFIERNNLTFLRLPSWSSPLNCQEKVWSQYKLIWCKKIASFSTKYDFNSLESDVKDVAEEVRAQLTSKILRSSAKEIQAVKDGHLV